MTRLALIALLSLSSSAQASECLDLSGNYALRQCSDAGSDGETLKITQGGCDFVTIIGGNESSSTFGVAKTYLLGKVETTIVADEAQTQKGEYSQMLVTRANLDVANQELKIDIQTHAFVSGGEERSSVSGRMAFTLKQTGSATLLGTFGFKAVDDKTGDVVLDTTETCTLSKQEPRRGPQFPPRR